MQKPTPCIYVHARISITIYAGAYNTPMSIYHYLFSIYNYLKFLRFQMVKNKRLVNAIKYVCNPNPRVSTQTPKRGTAMQRNCWQLLCGCKGTKKFWITQVLRRVSAK